MVSFSCEVCNDTVLKKKCDQHKQRCRGAYYTCIDCSVTFQGNDYRGHTSCISEAEKYEKALYKGPKRTQAVKKVDVTVAQKTEAVEKKEKTEKAEKTKKNEKTEKKEKKAKQDSPSLASYVSNKTSLYKVLKQITSDSPKSSKKALLKKLQLVKNADGSVSISL